ncbi:MAG: adenosine kinase, partial [Bacteroidetes bacterium]|nr:adenosine kinase [Bacteroidota bacterium]
LHFYLQGQQPEGFVKTSQLQEQDPQSKNELYDLLTFDTDIGKDSVDIWQEFENIFQRLNGFTYYRDIYQPYHKAAFDSLLADGVQHVEIRARLNGGLYDLENPKNYYNSDSLVMALKEVMEEVQLEHPEFTLKLIYTSIRLGTKEVVLDQLINAYHIRKKYPDLVVGFDLVANEDDGNTTLYFLENWLKMDSLNQAFGIDMPLYLHDGESNWSTLTNLYDAVLLNSRRIGHGFNLAHYPTLIEQVKQKNISIEISPLSNQILGYVSDLRMHPGQYFLANGVQCTISSDDPGVFGYNGLSYDYWSIFLAWELDLRSLKKLVMNSLEYSSLNDKEKQRAFEHWESQWQKFIKYADGYLDELII